MGKPMGAYSCSTCGCAEYYTHEYVRGGWASGNKVQIQRRCKACAKRLTAEYKKADTPKARAYMFRSNLRRRVTRKQNRSKLRAAVIAGYGGRCTRCWVTNPAVLDLDHVDGRTGPRTNTESLYKRVAREEFPAEFQILCRNCNWEKWVTAESRQRAPVARNKRVGG